jgi:TPR repeat protein
LVACAAAAIVFSLIVGNASAGPFEDGEAALQRSDYATALRLFEKLAEQGDSRAQYRLGSMYDFGGKITKRP